MNKQIKENGNMNEKEIWLRKQLNYLYRRYSNSNDKQHKELLIQAIDYLNNILKYEVKR